VVLPTDTTEHLMAHPAARHLALCRLVLCLSLLLGLGLAQTPAARAAGAITVTTLQDANNANDGKCSLREAVQAALNQAPFNECGGAGASPNLITFGVAGTIKLTGGPLNINTSIAITGPITLDGNKADRLFVVGSSGTLALTNLVIINGKSAGGGAILNNGGTLIIAGTVFNGNQGSSNGGAIQSTGALTIVGSTFTGNKSDALGGAIAAEGSTKATIAGTTFSGNSAVGSGGAIYASTTTELADVIFSGNIADGDTSFGKGGGAIFNNGSSDRTLSIVRSAFNGNLSPKGNGGAIYNNGQGPVTIRDSSFNGNLAGTPPSTNQQGGAIQNLGQLTLQRTLLLANAVTGDGGGIANDRNAQLTLVNVTLTANAATGKGGGVFNLDTQGGSPNTPQVTARNVTFSANAAASQGGGLHNGEGAGAFSLGNTTVDGSDGQGAGGNCSGPVTAQGRNLDSGASCGFGSAGGNLSGVPANLNVPFFNGGPLASLLSQSLKPGSPAIDAGDPALCAGDLVANLDQRGKPRPQDGDGDGAAACDLGAYENDTVAPGFGSAPVAPGPVPVGSAIVNEGTASGSLSIFNTGDAPLKVSGPSLGGSHPGDFAVDPALSLTLSDATPAAIPISCKPTAAGARTASLTLATNDPARPSVTFTLLCVGTAKPQPAFGATPSAPGPLSFGQVFLGTTGNVSLSIKNQGDAPLTVTTPALSGVNPAEFTVDAGLSLNLAPRASQSVTLGCAPVAPGVRTATLTLATNDPARPSVSFALGCSGAVKPLPPLETGGQSLGTALVDGQPGPYGMAVSPDGRHAYATDIADDTLTIYGRNSDGTLLYLNTLVNGSGGISGMDQPYLPTVSPDGRNVYVTGGTSNAVVSFSRDPESGALTFLSRVTQADSYGLCIPTCPKLDGLLRPYQVLISPDGRFGYMSSIDSNKIVVLNRNQETGELRIGALSGPVQLYPPAGSPDAGAFGGTYGIAMSPDGANIYATNYSADPDTLVVLRRDGVKGTLAPVETYNAAQIPGLNGVFRVAVSPDGANVYTASFDSSSLVAFSRDLASGKLTHLATYTDGQGGVEGTGTTTSVAVSPDGAYVYATGYDDKAVVAFAREAGTGRLTPAQVVRRNPLSGSPAAPALDGARDVAVCPDGRVIFVTALKDNRVVALRLANALPTLESLTPASTVAGGPGFTLTVNGSSFVPGASVRWNGAPLSTTFVSSGQLKALVSAALVTAAGSATVDVLNPAPGGGASNSLPFTVTAPEHNPVPSVTYIAPQAVEAGGPAFVLSIVGANFIPGSKGQLNGTDRPTTFISSTRLQLQVSAADIAQPGVAGVRVVNPVPGGGASNVVQLTIAGPGENPAPTIERLEPPWARGGPTAAEVTLTVAGAGFTSDSQVRWNGAARPTVYVSPTELGATIPALDLANAGSASVTVVTPAPGGGASNPASFRIAAAGDNPVPVLRAAVVERESGGGFRVTLSGSGFVAGAQARWNGATRPGNVASGEALSFTLTAAEFARGTGVISVVNPSPGGGESNELLLPIFRLVLPLIRR